MGQSITSLDFPTLPAPPKRAAHIPRPVSRYESARSTENNRGLWAGADAMSANALNDANTRYKLRNRSRYEDQNNGYVSGLIGDRANETIGTGPRLQLTLPDQIQDPDFQRAVAIPEDAARQVELKWADWCEQIGLLDKLLTLDETETRDGECFGLKFTNPQLDPAGPQLDLRLYEADQVATPTLDVTDPKVIDGIRFDDHGNPVEYHFLRRHPGDVWSWLNPILEFDPYPARRVIHFFKPRRPGQARGVPPHQSSLPLMGVLRAYTAATLGSAELQAKITGTIESDYSLPVGDEGDAEQPDIEPMQQIPFGQSVLMTLPSGLKAKAFDATQPSTGYREFKNEIVTEAGRPLNAPRSVSTGSSAEYNYASGRLDQQQWHRSIRIRRARIVRIVLNNLFRDWLREAALIPGFLPPGLPPVSEWRWKWRWDGFVSIDPVKDSTAAQIALASGQTTFDRVCGEQGEDWEEVLEQRARERAKALALGLPDPFAAATPSAPAPSAQGDNADG